MIWLYSLLAVLIVSLLSFSGALVLFLKKDALKNILLVLVAFSTGALLGDAFIHLIPEAVRDKGEFNAEISILIFAGILLFFILEKFLRWRHCHDIDCEIHPTHLGTMNLIGDGFHNFFDGVLIAASFMVSAPLGIATTIAVIAHEIPQELGDFGVLLHSGYTKTKALWANFWMACIAIIGALLTLIVGESVGNIEKFIVPITAGGFIYIALSGLVPELHKEQGIKRSFTQLIVIIAGLGVMYILLFME